MADDETLGRFSETMERDVDLLLLEEICCSPFFCTWFYEQVSAQMTAEGLPKLVGLECTAERSVGATGDGYGETDILVTIRGIVSGAGQVVMFLIEDKIDSVFTANQVGRSRQRLLRKVEEQECASGACVLVAPGDYLPPMHVGIPKEVKSDEYRVGMMPVGAAMLVKAGHHVSIESNAGLSSGFPDEDYVKAGATIVSSAKEIFEKAEMIVKVKEPQSQEIAMFRPGQIVFTYFHFAAGAEMAQGCLEAEIVAIAYETIKDKKGTLPCLTPMSEIAGKMSIQEGAKYLEKPMMGRGILLGGVPGVAPAHVLVLGGGIVGTNAAKVAAGLGADVVIMDVSLDRLRYLDDVMPANVKTIFSDAFTIRDYLLQADLVVGAVLIPGAKAPRLVTRQDLVAMKNGSVIVDVAIDQGGCVETARPTTHQQPTYVVDGVVHYCVTNMPGAVGRTSTIALCNATLPYALKIANGGYEKAAAEDAGFGEGINMVGGRVTNSAVAEALHMQYQPLRGK